MGMAKWLAGKALSAASKKYGGVKQSALRRCPNSPNGKHKMSASTRDVYNIEDDEGKIHKITLHMCGNGCGKVMNEQIH